MKKEEIEQLLAEYVTGKISAQNRLLLENLLANDPALKQEADEMVALWQMMDNTIVDGNDDEQFYNMLHISKQNENSGKIINLKSKAWLYAAAAAVCIIMFFAGRFTAAPVEVIKYKTLIVKQAAPAPLQQQVVKIAPLAITPKLPAKVKPKAKVEEPSALAQQLRSVYVSERIDAIGKLSTKKTLSKDELKLLELALNEDPNPNVRLMVINSMRPLINIDGAQQVLISGLSRQNNLLVQSLLVDVLVETKSKEAIPQMLALLDNKNTDVIIQNKIRGGIESFIN
ncbi:MAG: HEAT repeat domain-containing protein [Mucilaginibacter sp.]